MTHERIIVFRSGGNRISRTAKLTGCCSEAQVKRVWARHQKESGKQEMLSQKLSSARCKSQLQIVATEARQLPEVAISDCLQVRIKSFMHRHMIKSALIAAIYYATLP
ncbi:hypothetical protein NKH10_25210 [Mesorhizobium sp. M1340]|uniref:hypothetical protein n=1 Tax=Mesorhizobium sp. M1340 TaxID=2957087 RepID=UPI003338D584